MAEAEKTKESWKERKIRIRHKWLIPLIFPEWLCERVSYFLEQWAFLDILSHAGRLTILIAVITYFMGAEERRIQAENQRRTKHFQAWQLIDAAQGKAYSGGRLDALEDLNKDNVSLLGIDISKAHLPAINIENANLRYANLAEANLSNANLAGANLAGANLTGAKLRGANLTGALAMRADLTRAALTRANLTEARLVSADLTKAALTEADLTGARLVSADLTEALLINANIVDVEFWLANLNGAYLDGANLTGAKLKGANLTGADLDNIKDWQYIQNIKLANIYGVKNPPDGFNERGQKKGGGSIENYNEGQQEVT